MASLGSATHIPEGRPNRRFYATATLVVLAVVLAVAAQGLKNAIPGYVDQLQNTSASDSLNADQAIQTAGNAAQGASHFFDSSNKVLHLVGGLASAGFAA